MDFDSLKISENESSRSNFSPVNYSNAAKTAETKAADEKFKVNSAELKMDREKNQQKKSNENDAEEVSFKGSYNKENLENAIKIANEKIKQTSRQFSYSIHEKTKQVMISIKDSEGKIIKEIPSEESLDFYAKLQELSGMLLDERR